MELELVGAEDLRRYTDRRRYVIIDLRSEREYSLGHFPGAVNIPYRDFDVQNVTWGRTCVFYCERGVNSIELARRLAEQGKPAVAVVTPYREWRGKYR